MDIYGRRCPPFVDEKTMVAVLQKFDQQLKEYVIEEIKKLKKLVKIEDVNKKLTEISTKITELEKEIKKADKLPASQIK